MDMSQGYVSLVLIDFIFETAEITLVSLSFIQSVIREEIELAFAALLPQNNNAVDKVATPPKQEKAIQFTWGGKFHRAPKEFLLPSKCQFRQAVDLWFFGKVLFE